MVLRKFVKKELSKPQKMRTIQLYLILSILTTFLGCSLEEEEETNFLYELVTIEEATFPEEFIEGEVYTITVSYFRPTDCHSFYGFDYTQSDNERTVAVVNVVVDNNDCAMLEMTDSIDVSFDFLVGSEDLYIFKFWQGRNEEGENQYFSVEVPVLK